MKKYSLLAFILLLLAASIVFNYKLNNQLESSVLLVETLKVELIESGIKNNTLESKLSNIAEDLNLIKEQLQSKTELLLLVDKKLQADGQILEKIDTLLIDNNKLKKELNAVYIELNILESEKSKEIEASIFTENQLTQWDNDLNMILDLLDDRISVLEDGASSLSAFSIERIMVNQEIEFLETIYSYVKKFKDSIVIA